MWNLKLTSVDKFKKILERNREFSIGTSQCLFAPVNCCISLNIGICEGNALIDCFNGRACFLCSEREESMGMEMVKLRSSLRR